MELTDGGSSPGRQFGPKHVGEGNNGHVDVADWLSRVKSRPGLFHGHGDVIAGMCQQYEPLADRESFLRLCRKIHFYTLSNKITCTYTHCDLIII